MQRPLGNFSYKTVLMLAVSHYAVKAVSFKWLPVQEQGQKIHFKDKGKGKGASLPGD